MSFDGKEIKDELGRTIILRKPNVMDQYYLNKSLGEDAKNPTCYSMMLPIIYVAKIDNQVIERPLSYQECLASLQRLGNEGITAIAEAINESLTPQKEQIENIKKS